MVSMKSDITQLTKTVHELIREVRAAKRMGGKTTSQTVCYKCGKEGHLARDHSNRNLGHQSDKIRVMCCEDSDLQVEEEHLN